MKQVRSISVARIALTLGIGIAIYGASDLGLSLAFEKNGVVSPIWPATGIALAAVLLLGDSLWIAIFLGAFFSNALAKTAPLVSALIAVGNVLEALIGASLLRRTVPSGNYFDTLKAVSRFIFLGSLPGTAICATIGVLSLTIFGLSPWEDFPMQWFAWWIGNAGGILVVVPWLFTLKDVRKLFLTQDILPFISLLIACGTVCFATFGPPSYPLAFLVVLLLVWAAVRFHRAGVCLVVVLVSLSAIWGTSLHHGPFSSFAEHSFVFVQIFTIASALASLIGTALISERRSFEKKLRKGEEVLRASEERFRQLAENIREVFYIADFSKPAFLYLSPAFETVWKRKPEEIYQSPSAFFETIHPDDRALLMSSIAKQFEGEATSKEYRILDANGNFRWILDRGFPIRDRFGRVYRVAGIAEDVTMRKEVDAELRRKAEDLLRANQELDQFASMASHDLKAPMRTISAFMRLLKMQYHGRLDAKADEYIDFSVDSCKRMNQLIEDILRNARINGLPPQLSTVSLETAVNEVLVDLGREIDRTGTQVIVGELPEVIADPTHLREVFQNIIGNAIKFRSSTPARIVISSTREARAWQVAVQDNGIGISKESTHRVFDSFVRLHPTGTYEGSGIGLATCKKVIAARGGNIWVESKVGEGSTFYFTIPDGTDES